MKKTIFEDLFQQQIRPAVGDGFPIQAGLFQPFELAHLDAVNEFHGDHTGGNKAVVTATGAKVIAHENARSKIPNMDIGVGAGDVVNYPVDGPSLLRKILKLEKRFRRRAKA